MNAFIIDNGLKKIPASQMEGLCNADVVIAENGWQINKAAGAMVDAAIAMGKEILYGSIINNIND